MRKLTSLIPFISILLCTMVADTPNVMAAVLQPAIVSEDPVDVTPQLVATEAVPIPHVNAIGQIGSTLFAGGFFDRVAPSAGSPTFARQNFFAFTMPTGALASGTSGYTDPVFNGRIWAISTAGTSLFVGGEFSTVNGISRNRLVKLNAATGAVDLTFNAGFLGGIVFDLKMWKGPNGNTPMLIVGGTMGKKLYALNPATGANTGYFNSFTITGAIPNAWGGVAIYKMAINPAGTKLVATGNFQTVKGQSRTRLFIADLTASSAALDPWYYPGFAKPCSSTHPRRIAYLQGVDFSPDGTYFVVTATGQIPLNRPDDIWPNGSATYHTVCDAAGRFNLADDQHPVWINYTGGDSMWSTAVTGVAVYVQGHFVWLDNPHGFDGQNGGGAVQRLGIGAINPVTGKALPWDPPKPAAIGGKSFLATGGGLWVVSDSPKFNNEPHRGIAFARLP